MMKKIFAAIAISTLSASAIGQTTTATAHISQLVTGWGYDSFTVNLGTPIVNPANCPTNDAAVVSYDSQGYKTYYAAALTAFTTDSPVQLVISNTTCEGPRPRIIGIQMTH